MLQPTEVRNGNYRRMWRRLGVVDRTPVRRVLFQSIVPISVPGAIPEVRNVRVSSSRPSGDGDGSGPVLTFRPFPATLPIAGTNRVKHKRKTSSSDQYSQLPDSPATRGPERLGSRREVFINRVSLLTRSDPAPRPGFALGIAAERRGHLPEGLSEF